MMKAHVWTNFFYILAGLICFGLNAPLYIFYAFATLGILSWLGHYTNDSTGWLADHYGMYIAFSAIVSFVSGNPLIGIFALFATFLINFTFNMYIAIGTLYTVCFAFFSLNHTVLETASVGALFLIGFIWQRLGQHAKGNIDTKHENEIYHSLWHLFTSVGMSLMILL